MAQSLSLPPILNFPVFISSITKIAKLIINALIDFLVLDMFGHCTGVAAILGPYPPSR